MTSTYDHIYSNNGKGLGRIHIYINSLVGDGYGNGTGIGAGACNGSGVAGAGDCNGIVGAGHGGGGYGLSRIITTIEEKIERIHS